MTSVYDLLVDRSAYNSFGLYRPRVLGSAYVVFLINGRRIPAPNDSYVLELLPISAIERIEILSGSAAALHSGEAIGGAVNIVLRRDYEGFEVQGGAERPSAAGGESEHGHAVWGGNVGGGHFVAGVEGFRRQEVRSADRDYSRSSWTAGGAFADTSGVSIGGNTLLIPAEAGTIARPLGSCEGHGYVGPSPIPEALRAAAAASPTPTLPGRRPVSNARACS